MFDEVVLEVTTTERLYNTPGTKPVTVSGFVRLVELNGPVANAVVLSETLISLVSIVTPLTGIAASLTSILCEVPTTA